MTFCVEQLLDHVQPGTEPTFILPTKSWISQVLSPDTELGMSYCLTL
jgi:hypothetical protein